MPIDGKRPRIRSPAMPSGAASPSLRKTGNRAGSRCGSHCGQRDARQHRSASAASGSSICSGRTKCAPLSYIKSSEFAPNRRGKLAGPLSGGNQQKIVIAKWLFRQAEIFLFDEPTRGIDVGAKVEVFEIMNELAKSGRRGADGQFRTAGTAAGG